MKNIETAKIVFNDKTRLEVEKEQATLTIIKNLSEKEQSKIYKLIYKLSNDDFKILLCMFFANNTITVKIGFDKLTSLTSLIQFVETIKSEIIRSIK